MADKGERNEADYGDKRYVRRDDTGKFMERDAGRTSVAGNPPKVRRSAKTGRVERALSSASKRTGAFEKKY